MESNCIFCKIIAKEIPSKTEYEDDLCISFHDINPRAKTHLVIIPKKHLSTMKDVERIYESTMGRMLIVASELAKKFNLNDYKLSISTGKEAGQEVFHIHLHLMSVN